MSITRFFRASPLPATVPAQVSGVTPTVGNAQVALSWQPPSNNGSPITAYTVRYRVSNTGSYAVFGSTGNTSLPVTGLTNGVAYQFTVEATNGVGAGPASDPIAASPAAPAQNQLATPAGFQAAAIGATTVSGSWTAVANASAYIVERSTDVGFSQNLSSVYVGTGTTFTDAAAALTTLYYYRVKATGTGYSDSGSATVSVNTTTYAAPSGTQLAAPAAPQATPSSATSLNVTASSAANATGYKLFRSATSGGTYAQVGGTLTTPSYADTGLTASTTYYYKWQALGNGTSYLDSALGAAFSGITSAAPTLVGYNVIYGGNSNVEARGDGWPNRTAAFLAPEGDYLHYNGGVSGWGIGNLPTPDPNSMLGDFTNRVTSRIVAGRTNIVVGMEGTNTLNSIEAGPGFVTSVKQWCQQALDAGAQKVFWISTLPRTTAPGYGAGFSRSWQVFKSTNDQLAIDLPAMGVTFIDLDHGKSQIGSIGTVDEGDSPDFSSYIPYDPTPGPNPYTVGRLVGTNRFYYDAQQFQSVHLQDHGFNVMGRIVADYILNYVKGYALPDRSQYDAAPVVTPPAAVQMTWINVKGADAYVSSDGRDLGTNGSASFVTAANSNKSLGTTADAYKGELNCVVLGSASMFIGLNDADSSASFTDLKIGLFLEEGGVFSYWNNANKLGTIAGFSYTDQEQVPVKFKVYADRVEVYLQGVTTAAATWSVVMNAPCWIDASLSISANHVVLGTIDAPSIVDTPTF